MIINFNPARTRFVFALLLTLGLMCAVSEMQDAAIVQRDEIIDQLVALIWLCLGKPQLY